MKCDLSDELLTGYLDGELTEKQKQLVEEHLKTCASCREELEEFQQLDQHMRAAAIEEPSREFVFGLNRKVMEAVAKRKRFSFFRLTPVLAPVAVAVLVLIVLVNLDRGAGSVNVKHRVLFAETGMRRDFDVRTPSLGGARYAPEEKEDVVREKGMVEAPHLAAAKPPMAAKKTEALDTYDEAAMVTIASIELPKDKIVRAIVDSTGMVVKVATGNTINPERDTMLENRLQGQQLTPPTVAGHRTQLYVDFTQKQEKDN